MTQAPTLMPMAMPRIAPADSPSPLSERSVSGESYVEEGGEVARALGDVVDSFVKEFSEEAREPVMAVA